MKLWPPLATLPLAPTIYDSLVTFQAAFYPVGGSPSYTGGVTIPAYVENPVGAASGDESDESKPIAMTQYNVFTGTDPSIGLGRKLTNDDIAIWINQNETLQIIAPPSEQAGEWVTKCVAKV